MDLLTFTAPPASGLAGHYQTIQPFIIALTENDMDINLTKSKFRSLFSHPKYLSSECVVLETRKALFKKSYYNYRHIDNIF